MFEGFHSERFAVERCNYDKRSKSLTLHFQKWKTADKGKYIEHFSEQNWNSLPEFEKKQHGCKNCQACSVHHFSFQATFPSWANKKKQLHVPLQDATNKIQSRVLKPSGAVNVKPTLKAIKKAANKIYEEINGPFKELFGMSFAKAQTKTPELYLQEIPC